MYTLHTSVPMDSRTLPTMISRASARPSAALTCWTILRRISSIMAYVPSRFFEH